MDTYKVAILADEYETARLIWQAHAMANTPADSAEARKSMVAFHVAEANMVQARKRLEEAKSE